MIYLQNTTESQVMFVPKNGITADGDMVFQARNTIDLAVEVDEAVIDLQTSELYYNLAISLPAGLPDGEYEYTLSVGKIILSQGLLQIGGFARPNEYDKSITYEQYETE